ncbi:hypothetical protein P3S68_025460 [Capsicum galapagoense]
MKNHKHESRRELFRAGSTEFESQTLTVLILVNVDLLNDGLRLEFENSTDVKSKDFKIPRNVYRAVLEVYVSFHENDESWYANPVNEYVSLNNLTVPGNGAFREVVVSLDEMVAGAVWPFTVIYTGGANPLFWRPISGIGSFDLPSYDIEITPLLGKILDGSSHKISFRVTDALNVWYVDANLHLWLDGESMKTEGKSLKCSCSTLSFYHECRSIILTGMVKSSYGTITTKSSQGLSYISYMVMGNEGNLQIVDQIIEFNDTVYAAMPSSSVYSLDYVSVSNVTLELEDKRVKSFEYGSFVSAVNNLQKAEGYMIVKGLASTRQVYDYNDDSCCYFRNISSSGDMILHDKVIDSCSKSTRSHWPLKIGKRWSSYYDANALLECPLYLEIRLCLSIFCCLFLQKFAGVTSSRTCWIIGSVLSRWLIFPPVSPFYGQAIGCERGSLQICINCNFVDVSFYLI